MLRAVLLLAALAGVSGSHWDHDIAPIDAPAQSTRTYNPIATTFAAARTWTPNYPSPFVYENVQASVQPACPMEKLLDRRALPPGDGLPGR